MRVRCTRQCSAFGKIAVSAAMICVCLMAFTQVRAIEPDSPEYTTNEEGAESEIDSTDVVPSIVNRFADPEHSEVPDFQKHVVPLFSRLGCNGRACHGSFQGQGGFRLSLFGYDFNADHAALLDEEGPRIDLEYPLDSLILDKPTDAYSHEGGQRYEAGKWEYHVFLNWIKDGAQRPESLHQLAKLHVSPSEIIVGSDGEEIQLTAIAEWADGTLEDVTALCRFQTNNEQNALIDGDGLVTSVEPGDTHVVVFYDKAVVPVPVIQPVTELVGESYPEVEASTEIDRLVIDKLSKLGVIPSEVADDATFLRRVYLDVTGTLPTPDEIRSFVEDDRADKRERVINELLETPAYAAWWTTKLCDLTGNNNTQLQNVLPDRGRANQDWYDWIYRRVEENKPYDELVEGIVTASSRREGQTYREYSEEMSEIYRNDSGKSFADLPTMPYYWARRDFRNADARAINFAYAFMGVRIQCAECHKHPFDQWSKNDFDQFTRFFTKVLLDANGRNPSDREEYNEMIKELGVEGRGNQIRRQFGQLLNDGKTVPFPQVIVVEDPRNRQRRQRGGAVAQLLGDREVRLDEVDDPRVVLMDWLRDEENPYFATAFVNRVWEHYFGIGIVAPADDLSLANPPSNRELLEYLADGFRDSGFDMKWLHREILLSDTYQRSWKTNESNERDQTNFSHAYFRQMPAEVVFDTMLQATANEEQSELFLTNMERRSIAIPGSAPTQGARDPRTYALSIFGRSTRESNCDCDRSQEASLLQTVYRQNDQNVINMLNRENGGWIASLELAASPQQLENAKNRVTQLEGQIENANTRLRQMTQRENRDRNAENQLRQRRRQMMTEVERMRERIADAESREFPDIATIVVDAYLKTVSRFPTAEEMDRSILFINEAETPMEGVRGLMWALLNTKEFIVIH